MRFLEGIDAQRVGDERATVEVVHVQHADLADAGLHQLGGGHGGQDLVGLGEDLAGLGVDHVVGEHLADQVVGRHRQAVDAGVLELAHVPRGDAAAFLDDHLVADADLEARRLAAQPARHQAELDALRREVEGVLLEEQVEHLLVAVAERAQQDGDRQLAAAVDARVHAVLGVELEVEPGAAVGNHARREQQLARAVGLAAVVVEEHAGAAVQLRDDDALGAVDDERAVVGHQRQLAQVHLLLADVLDGLLGARRFLVEHHQAHLDAQRGRVGEAAQLALLDVEHGLAEAVAHVLEEGIAGVTDDREHAAERRVQADVVAAFLGGVRLQELAIGIELDGEQVGHLEDARPLAEILADALLLGEGICHCEHPLTAGYPARSARRLLTQRRASRPAGNPASRLAARRARSPRIAVT
jgi:hypothetical protein